MVISIKLQIPCADLLAERLLRWLLLLKAHIRIRATAAYAKAKQESQTRVETEILSFKMTKTSDSGDFSEHGYKKCFKYVEKAHEA